MPNDIESKCYARSRTQSALLWKDIEYLENKKKCRKRIEDLKEQLSNDVLETKSIEIEKTLDTALQSIGNIPKLYKDGEIKTRGRIIGSIFPQNWSLREKLIELPE